jgi:Protein of unknown function (DUF2948)
LASRLKLRAEDEEDLAVISAMLQDSLVPVEDMCFLPDEKRFVMVVNRFRWESEQGARERTLTGLCFSEVAAAKVSGFSRGEGERILEVLALRAGDGIVQFDFAGGERLRLEVGRLLCHVEDIGEPWPTQWRPSHPGDAGEPGAR